MNEQNKALVEIEEESPEIVDDPNYIPLGGEKGLVSLILKKGVDREYDCIMGITGMNGKGKSTFGIHFAIEACKQLNLPFSLKAHVIYSQKEAEERLRNGIRGFPILDDEAVNTALKYDWATEKQQRLIKLFDKIRVEGKIYMLCMPYFSNFAPYFRKHRLRFWVYILSRGFALLFQKSDNQHSEDPWYNKDNDQLVSKYFTPLNFNLKKIVDAYEGSPNFMGYTTFPKLPTVLRNEYLDYSRAHKLADSEEEAVMSRQEKRAKIALLRVMGTLKNLPDSVRPTYADWAEVSGLPEPTLTRWASEESSSLLSMAEFLNNNKKFSKFFGFLTDKWADFVKQQKSEMVNRPAFEKKKENEKKKEENIFEDNEIKGEESIKNG